MRYEKVAPLLVMMALATTACHTVPDAEEVTSVSESIEFAIQFEPGRDGAGTFESYTAHEAGLPLPQYYMKYGSVFVWHQDPEEQARLLTNQALRASRVGIRKMLFTPTAIYGSELDTRFDEGTVPALDELVSREWVSVDEPGFLDALLAQRDTISDLVEQGLVDSIVLRPFQEAGSGIHDNAGLTPDRYKALIEWMVDDLYSDIPIDAVIVHWNTLDGLAESLPDLDDESIEIYAGVTISMPSHAAMASIALLETDPDRVLDEIRSRDPELAGVALDQGVDFASRAWEEAGVQTWIAEFSVFDDGRVDPLTGWQATGLSDPSAIEGFFEHYENLRETGHIGGITWLNKKGFTGRDTADPDLKDGRWDGEQVHPDVLVWWLNELTHENGYDLP